MVAMVGIAVGVVAGVSVPVSVAVGKFVGLVDGAAVVGALVGGSGIVLGAFVGTFMGAFVGTFVGVFVGALEGTLVGALVGSGVGRLVGVFVGARVGDMVGEGVSQVLVGASQELLEQSEFSKHFLPGAQALQLAPPQSTSVSPSPRTPSAQAAIVGAFVGEVVGAAVGAIVEQTRSLLADGPRDSYSFSVHRVRGVQMRSDVRVLLSDTYSSAALHSRTSMHSLVPNEPTAGRKCTQPCMLIHIRRSTY